MAITTRRTTSKSGRHGGALPAAKPAMGKADAGSRVWMTTAAGLRSADSEASHAGFGPDLPALTESPLTITSRALLRTDYRHF